MFNKNYNYSSLDNKFQKRAEILFNHPDNEKNINKLKMKNLPLGKSVYDEDDDDDKPLKLAKSEKIKGSELDILDEFDKNNKNASEKNPDKKQTEIKSKKEKTPEDEAEFLNEFYPSMKHFDKDKINQTDNESSPKDKKGHFTGSAVKIPETISNNHSNTDTIKNNSSLDKMDNTVFSDYARKKARNFIQGAEDFKEDAYQDEKGIWTIGYGHTKGVKPGDKITKEEAEKLYAEDFKIHSEPLKHVKVPLTDNEKAALASLVFNIGEPQFKNSTVLRKLNEGDKKAAAEAFKLFCKESKTKIIDGKPVKKLEFSKGLYNRRIREMELFLTPDDK